MVLVIIIVVRVTEVAAALMVVILIRVVTVSFDDVTSPDSLKEFHARQINKEDKSEGDRLVEVCNPETWRARVFVFSHIGS